MACGSIRQAMACPPLLHAPNCRRIPCHLSPLALQTRSAGFSISVFVHFLMMFALGGRPAGVAVGICGVAHPSCQSLPLVRLKQLRSLFVYRRQMPISQPPACAATPSLHVQASPSCP